MSDGKGTWGGKREGAGRRKGWRKGFSEQRKQHQVRAYDEEWEIIKAFAAIVKKDRERAERVMKEMKA